MPEPPPLLSRKEVAFAFGRDRVTVWRWECEGLRFRDGRVTEAEVAWFLEQRDAARRLKMGVPEFLALPRPALEHLLRAALCVPADATSCNIATGDSFPDPGI